MDSLMDGYAIPPKLTGAEVEDRINALVQNAIESAEFFWEVRANWQSHSPDCPDWMTFCDTILIPRFEKNHIKSYSRQRIEQMVGWYEVKRSLPADLSDRVTNEAQGRELARIPADMREEVMREALRTAPNHPKFPGAKQNTAAHIKATAERLAAPIEAYPATVDVNRDFFNTPVHPDASPQSTEPDLSPAPPLPPTADTPASTRSLADTDEDDTDSEEDDEPGDEQVIDFPPLERTNGNSNGVTAMRYDAHLDKVWLTVCRNGQHPFALPISGKSLRFIMGLINH